MAYKARIYGLDLMRAIAITMVVFSHSLYIFQGYNNVIISAVQVIGVQGVEVFFVLSGFLIGGMLFRLIKTTQFSRKELFHFWVRRWFRTLPLYFLMLLINIVVALLLGYELPQTLWRYFFFLQNFSAYHVPFFPESWSLSVEEFAYLLGPFCLFTFYKIANRYIIKKEKIFLLVSMLLVFVFLISKFIYYWSFLDEVQSLRIWNSNLKAIVIYRLDAIFYGFILLYYFKQNKTKIEKLKDKLFIIGIFLWVMVLVILPLSGITIQTHTFYWNVLYLPFNSIAICLMLPYLCFLRPPRRRFFKFVKSISVYSYAMYLLHYNFILYLMQIFLDFQKLNLVERIIGLFVYLSLTYFLSKIVYTYFEKPITNLRDSKRIKNKLKINVNN
ncbi:acyltransferase [uncultured Algibacter sp.]|uniref:acyltransferase family protein n=1 Tax=uncultured Algibacter sp. TaxID=298659 RepID=UPI00260C0D25|nr:acyltransferase [uncultured Algibacter sp.]